MARPRLKRFKCKNSMFTDNGLTPAFKCGKVYICEEIWMGGTNGDIPVYYIRGEVPYHYLGNKRVPVYSFVKKELDLKFEEVLNV